MLHDNTFNTINIHDSETVKMQRGMEIQFQQIKYINNSTIQNLQTALLGNTWEKVFNFFEVRLWNTVWEVGTS